MGDHYSGTEIDKIGNAIKSGANPMQYKEQLAQQIVGQYHGADAGQKALDEWKRVHSERQVPEDMESFAVPEPTALFRIMCNAKLGTAAVLLSAFAPTVVCDSTVRLSAIQTLALK